MKNLISIFIDRRMSFCLFILLLVSLQGCRKYLEVSPDKSLVIPSSLEDLQALIDNNIAINRLLIGLGEASADNYYLTYDTWSTFNEGYKNAYIWGDELFFDNTVDNEWLLLYRPVYYANIVLENLYKIDRTLSNGNEWDNLKGSALFIRSRSFYILVTTFSKAYDSATANSDLGIPLRLSSDFNKKSIRATVAESYRRITTDLKKSISLLPVSPAHVIRPSKPAAFALLSRVYLSMRNYKLAGKYADSCLLLHPALMDYNGGEGVNTTGIGAVFDRFNPEVIFSAYGGIVPLTSNNAKVDTILYNSYEDNDLRKKLFFQENSDGSHAFVGNYFDQYTQFYGSATDEMYLTRSECEARQGHTDAALKDLNTLLEKRWKTGFYIPSTKENTANVLSLILKERRKELLFRNIRWMDIKRLNKEGKNIVLNRHLDGKVYTLHPNSNEFALPLPKYIIDMTGMRQNPR